MRKQFIIVYEAEKIVPDAREIESWEDYIYWSSSKDSLSAEQILEAINTIANNCKVKKEDISIVAIYSLSNSHREEHKNV